MANRFELVTEDAGHGMIRYGVRRLADGKVLGFFNLLMERENADQILAMFNTLPPATPGAGPACDCPTCPPPLSRNYCEDGVPSFERLPVPHRLCAHNYFDCQRGNYYGTKGGAA